MGVSIDYLVDGGLWRSQMLEHSAFPYRTDDDFRAIIAPFLAEGLERSEAVLAVTTGRNIELLRGELGTDARSVEFVDASCFYSTPIAALGAYREFFDSSLKRGAAWIRVVGEPTWADRPEAEVRLWTRYESLLNLVFAASPVTIVCPYDARSVAAEVVSHA
ncbi:MAG TPA: MEDS domain-containing protein, partial [Chloroflexota bacterium]